MCSSSLYSRDKRREVAVGIWIPVSDCYYNCISPGSGIRLVEKRPCRYCNTTASVQLCNSSKVSNPSNNKLFLNPVILSFLININLSY